MKLEKITHDHLLTKWLKVIIFSILMLAPIFSVAVRCAYVVCNKNAYQSYSGNETIEITPINTNSFEEQQIYYFSSSNYNDDIVGKNFGGSTNRITFELKEILSNSTNVNLENLSQIAFYKETNANNYYLFGYDNNGNVLIDTYNSRNTNLSFSFYYLTNNLNTNVLEYTDLFYTISNFKGNYLDNVFDYSVAQLQQDQLFNWTQQTGVYTGVNAMTTGLGLTDGTISILITYWTLLSIIYVIIDIVLEGFVALTHMILKKAS